MWYSMVAGLYGAPGAPWQRRVARRGRIPRAAPSGRAGCYPERARHNLCSSEEGALAGLVTGGGAATLEVWALVAGVLQIDWATYGAQVGQDVAAQVRGAIVPVTSIGIVLALVVCLAGCTLMGWLGAAGYTLLRDLRRSGRRHTSSQSPES